MVVQGIQIKREPIINRFPLFNYLDLILTSLTVQPCSQFVTSSFEPEEPLRILLSGLFCYTAVQTIASPFGALSFSRSG